MLKHEVNVIELEDVALELRCVVNMLFTIYSAISEGPCSPESYNDSLFGTYRYLERIVNKLDGLYLEGEHHE